MWAEESVMYQIYPLGFCGAPFENDGQLEHRILKVIDWIPHLKKLGITAVMFNPVFESDTHGYNTRDYRKIDVRLGTNEDFKKVCDALHENGMRVLLDGVFNHCGRGFAQFQDVLKNRENSPYRDWFYINFGGNDGYNDGLWYEGWEGNYDLVKLNLDNPAVSDYLMDSVRFWIDEWGIDGLRLDVAYMVNRNFLMRLRRETEQMKKDFYLIGEILGGDYRQIVNPQMCHSATNYECYKGMYSSFNSMNMFEINHSLIRQFGSDPWCLYRGLHLLNFVDNHDVTRVASILNNPRHLPLIYALCFAIPGYPCIYYGSEFGAQGKKEEGDPALRRSFDAPQWTDLTGYISKLAAAKKNSEALNYGDFRSVVLTNRQCIFERKSEHERVLVAVNADENEYVANFDAGCGRAVDLITGEDHDFGGGSHLAPYSAYYWKCER
ncbi:MAG: alpha-amylase family glycosyl hydrolase [Lachnospiraceae bacterium]|nr:alpha-amylase family glycosyl hydrolase [Lachnospiraceae bacterium]